MAEGGLNIFNAVKADDISLCKDLVDSGQCVNETNEKGEIPLHISMADTISIEITNVLLNAGSDLNAQNILGQTPLHYAVAGENVDKINLLLSNKSLDRHKIDINGYNAFHALIYATNDDSDNWKTKLSILVSSGVDVISQTNFGNTVLHIACNKFNNIDIVRTLMLLCPTIEYRSQNKNGENFLHSFIVRGLDEEANDFFDDFLSNKFERCNCETFMDLMNKQDIYGQTPFYLCLDSQELAITTVKKLLDHGADVNVQDGLGNTILHRIVSLSLGNCEQVVQLLCNAGADPNVMNKNGQSVLSMLQDGQLGVFNILLENEGEVNLKDRWNRDLSKISSKFHDEKFLERIQGICGMNELKDCFGATSLHYAAFTNNVFMINTLLKFGASTNNVDSNGFSPLDVAILFENNDSVSLLHGSYCSLDQEIYSRKRSRFEDIPKVIYSDHIKDLDNIVHVPTALTEFAISLLSTQSDIATEIRNINGQVKCFVEEICSKISEYDSDFALSVLPTGSSAEGTKVGIPDEYDFVVFLDKFSEICEIIQPDILEENSQDYAFACARLTDESKKISMSQYFVEKWTLNSWSVLQKLFFLLRRALFETCRSIEGNLYFKFENDIRHLSSKPVFNVTFVWIGSIYKELEISVDLVPAIRNLGWWPACNKISSMNMTKEARDAGCFLLFQAKQSALEKLIICGMDDSVDMLGRHDSAYEINLRTLLRISTAQAEIITMKSFPQIVRDSYMFSKILLKRTPRLLSYIRSGPEKTASNLLGISMFERAEYTRFSVDRIISSYMLKNCMFHVLAEFEKGDIDIGVGLQKKNIDFIGLTVLVFEHLLKCSEDIFLPSYFLPSIDVFSFEDVEIDEQNPEYLLAMTILKGHRLRMFLSIILHMLGTKAKTLN